MFFYCESKTSAQIFFLVTIINLFQKTGSFLLRSQDEIPLPCTDASFPGPVCSIPTIYYA